MQKPAVALAALLMLLFGCAAVQPQEKTLAQELGVLQPPPHSAFYYANVSSPAGFFQGTLSTYFLGENFRADVNFAGMDSYSILGINGSNYLCVQGAAGSFCSRQPDTMGGFGAVLSKPALLFSVQKLQGRRINGQDANCFSIEPKENYKYSGSISCYSEAGILLYSFSSDLAGGITTQTVLIGTAGAPSPSRFSLPYSVK